MSEYQLSCGLRSPEDYHLIDYLLFNKKSSAVFRLLVISLVSLSLQGCHSSSHPGMQQNSYIFYCETERVDKLMEHVVMTLNFHKCNRIVIKINSTTLKCDYNTYTKYILIYTYSINSRKKNYTKTIRFWQEFHLTD